MFQLAGQEMRHTVIRPRLRTPSALEVFNLLLADRGLACRYSDKGDFTFNAIRLWGGLDEIARDFSSFRKAAFFKDFLSDQESGAGPGVSLKSTNRRYLTFWDARRITSMDRENLRIWIDSLLDREIVSRGLIMRCSRCRYAAWYPGTRVGRTFECDRCRSEQTVDHAHWKAPSEPMWFYELSEVVFQALGFDTTEVVLALSELKNRSRQGFLYEPQMEIVRDGETISELDIWAIADGKVIVGEAKSAGRLGATAANEEEVARRVRSVADAASADVAIFATTADGEWRAATVRTVQEVFSNSVADLDWMSGLAPTS
jgi:hypothetical protein